MLLLLLVVVVVVGWRWRWRGPRGVAEEGEGVRGSRCRLGGLARKVISRRLSWEPTGWSEHRKDGTQDRKWAGRERNRERGRERVFLC